MHVQHTSQPSHESTASCAAPCAPLPQLSSTVHSKLVPRRALDPTFFHVTQTSSSSHTKSCQHYCSSAATKGLAISSAPVVGDTMVTAVPRHTCSSNTAHDMIRPTCRHFDSTSTAKQHTARAASRSYCHCSTMLIGKGDTLRPLRQG